MSEKFKECPNCGTKNAEENKFCENCGFNFGQMPIEEEPNEGDTQQDFGGFEEDQD